MNKTIQKIIDQMRLEGKDYTKYILLLDYIKKFATNISKDDFRDFLVHDFKLQVQTTSNELSRLISSFARKKHFNSAIDICCGIGTILSHLQGKIPDIAGI